MFPLVSGMFWLVVKGGAEGTRTPDLLRATQAKTAGQQPDNPLCAPRLHGRN
jgi:hypothetical protein